MPPHGDRPAPARGLRRPVSVFGHDTVSAIRAGVAGGMACEIADSFRMAGRCMDAGESSLPEAAAKGFCRSLCREAPVEKDVNLVGRGLMRIFNYNVAREQAFD